MNKQRYYADQLVTESNLNTLQDNVENSIHTHSKDSVGYGLVVRAAKSEVLPTQDSPLDFGIEIPSLVGFTYSGKRIVTTGTVDLSLSKKGNTQIGSLTASGDGDTIVFPTPGKTKYLAVILKPATKDSNPQADGFNNTVYFKADESFQFEIREGASANNNQDGSSAAVRPVFTESTEEGILICDVLMVSGETTVTNSRISVTRQKYLYLLSSFTKEHNPDGSHITDEESNSLSNLYVRKTGDNMTGNLTLDSGKTVDGVDISNFLVGHDSTGKHVKTKPSTAPSNWVSPFTENDHDGGGGGPKLNATNTHEGVDTSAETGIHHVIGPLANNVSAGNGTYSSTFSLDVKGSSANPPGQGVFFRDSASTWNHGISYIPAFGRFYLSNALGTFTLGFWDSGVKYWNVPLSGFLRDNARSDAGSGITMDNGTLKLTQDSSGDDIIATYGPLNFPTGFILSSIRIQTFMSGDALGKVAISIMKLNKSSWAFTSLFTTGDLDSSYNGNLQSFTISPSITLDNSSFLYYLEIDTLSVSTTGIAVREIQLGIEPISCSTI